MRANRNLFYVLAVFFVVAAAAYTIWHVIDTGEVEWVGTLAIALSGALAAFIGFFVARLYAAQNGELPEDRSDANVDDGDPELGFFSPWSWWPVILAAGAASVFLGLAVGIWIAIIGGGLALIALVGWTYEYYRGYFAR
ncbi:cytochrome c oxidase subunit 4 [Clavibacter lycopersici]|uniref:Cytochrome c oxidase polypeptide 4 n=1 Tax=Clavibacter lycopersici TaxID=2301718 RepID=A0A399TEQ9_9MICO|nr:cytochrome c oxidase subunit 4 [Clavibacter lycopersici]RIJ53205.1 cytochrome c oxidase subunit 4 [Clavibacter lycopersici]RIJ62642.1 cytochrome c oxidase subunit 4 [Clavibacter lycopersici]